MVNGCEVSLELHGKLRTGEQGGTWRSIQIHLPWFRWEMMFGGVGDEKNVRFGRSRLWHMSLSNALPFCSCSDWSTTQSGVLGWSTMQSGVLGWNPTSHCGAGPCFSALICLPSSLPMPWIRCIFISQELFLGSCCAAFQNKQLLKDRLAASFCLPHSPCKVFPQQL